MRAARKILTQASKRFGTPLYVYDARTIERQSRLLTQSMPNVSFYYACKANNNLVVLDIIRKSSIGIEAVSPGELRRARESGFAKREISFTCSNLSADELEYARATSGRVHLDSIHQIELWGKHRLGKHISLRLNQGIGAGHHQHVITGGPESKFGITLADLPRAQIIAKKYSLAITSLHQHIGSNILNESIMLRAVEKLLKTTERFPDIRHIDFGGGFGVPYRPNEKAFNMKRFGKKFNALVYAFARKTGKSITFSFEPGRFLVAEAGILLVRVVDIKKTARHTFVGVNSGFNHLVRPAMYGAYHHIDNVSRARGKRAVVTIAGNICESGDVFARKRTMILPRIGDILAIRDTGAYGMSMASAYNMRSLPQEILITRNETLKNISSRRS